MKKNGIFKMVAVTICSLASFSSVAAGKLDKQDYIADFSDPMAIYSNAGVGISDDGVDIYAGIGGYLAGSFKHKLQFEAKDDLEYYEVNYLAVDTSSDTGFLLDTTWDRDYAFGKDSQDTSFGVIKKLPLMNDRLNLYPKLKLGFLWGDEIKSTTYIHIDMATRFTITPGLWVGVTPGYTYGMKGIDLDAWNTSFDIGYMFKNGFGLSAQTIIDTHEDEEYRANVTFAF